MASQFIPLIKVETPSDPHIDYIQLLGIKALASSKLIN